MAATSPVHQVHLAAERRKPPGVAPNTVLPRESLWLVDYLPGMLKRLCRDWRLGHTLLRGMAEDVR